MRARFLHVGRGTGLACIHLHTCFCSWVQSGLVGERRITPERGSAATVCRCGGGELFGKLQRGGREHGHGRRRRPQLSGPRAPATSGEEKTRCRTPVQLNDSFRDTKGRHDDRGHVENGDRETRRPKRCYGILIPTATRPSLRLLTLHAGNLGTGNLELGRNTL